MGSVFTNPTPPPHPPQHTAAAAAAAAVCSVLPLTLKDVIVLKFVVGLEAFRGFKGGQAVP